MRRKRFKHMAQNMGQMFCGWQAASDYGAIAKLGTGILKINVLSRECYFNDKSIQPLIIAMVLQKWMEEDCARINIDYKMFQKAQLIVKLQLSHIKEKDENILTNQGFNLYGDGMVTDNWNRCDFLCESMIQNENDYYQSNYQSTSAWPVGWPRNTE